VLTVLEEIVLLTIDPGTGRLRSDPGVRYALAGALLFDLEIARRIDTGTTSITVISTAPTGNVLQDLLLADLASQSGPRTVRACLERIIERRTDLEGEAVRQLADRGIIRQETRKLLWVIDRQRFPLVDGKPQQTVTARLAQAVLADDIPDARDIMLVSLANACGLLSVVLAPHQIEARADWILRLSRIETISRNVGDAITAALKDGARGRVGPNV
jgi:hypothetical protein